MKKFLRQIKAHVSKYIDSLYCKEIESKKMVGSSDSWCILTDKIAGSIVYSGGVGKDITFEMSLANDYKCDIYLFDPSPTGIKTIESTNIPAEIRFFPFGLAKEDGKVSFGSPINPLEGSYRLGSDNSAVTFNCRSLSSLFKENNHRNIELLKIDIEGFEYEVIDDLIKNKLNIRQIAVEFHDFYKEIKRDRTRQSIRLLKSNGYTLIHKRGHDYTFVKSDTV